jgi:hypothetical protein
MIKNFPALVLPVALISPAVLSAAALVWPASKDDVAAAAEKPDKALYDSLRTQAVAAFDKRSFPESIGLNHLADLVRFASQPDLPPEVRAWLVANREEAEEFIGLLSRYDDRAAVARILGEIWKADEKGFRAHPRLAMAIALVYDRPCPEYFPHRQVTEKALPRKLHAPTEVFAFYKESQEGGRLSQSVDKLGIDELAFVVPVIAPFAELREVQKKRLNKSEIPKLYPSVAYDHGRLKTNTMVWPGTSYSLDTIKAKGGICVDQAYYTATSAQAVGVPAFILSGAGNGGFHAFVGFLDRPGKWKTDVGRYANQKYATGTAINPLTWDELTDHDLAFLEARFRNTPEYATVLLHVDRAGAKIAEGDLVSAAKLLAAARTSEARCPEVWATLALLGEKRGDTPAQMQSLYDSAAKALGKYRELEILWRSRLADSLEKQGKADAAFTERLAIIRRNAGTRPELAVELAAVIMNGALKTGDNKKAVQVFNKLAGQFDEAGPEFFRMVVYPVVGKLLEAGQKKEAQQISRSLSQKFKPEPDSQLAEMQRDIAACVEAGSMAGSRMLKKVGT